MSRADELAALPQPLSPEDRALVLRYLFENMEELGKSFRALGGKTKRLLGGAFSSGRFVIGSYVYRMGGLDRVRYTVLDERSFLALGTGALPSEALADAREVIKLVGLDLLLRHCEGVVERIAKEEAAALAERRQKADEWQATRRKTPAPNRVPRRRQRIFDASAGKCHYCGVALTLDGKWHIEHKMPRALMGGDEPSNLVAACVPCNSKKRDQTDVEFKASRVLPALREGGA